MRTQLTAFLILFFTSTSFAQDTLDLPLHRIGIGFSTDKIIEKSSDIFKSNQDIFRGLHDRIGYGFELSGFYEKKVFERVSLTLGLNLKQEFYKEKIAQKLVLPANKEVNHFFDIKKSNTSFVIPAIWKFYYFDKPKIYLLGGLDVTLSLKRNESPSYLESTFFGTFVSGEKASLIDNARYSGSLSKNVIPGYRVGLGIEIKKTQIELLLKTQPRLSSSRRAIFNRADEQINAIGINIKRSLKAYRKVNDPIFSVIMQNQKNILKVKATDSISVKTTDIHYFYSMQFIDADQQKKFENSMLESDITFVEISNELLYPRENRTTTNYELTLNKGEELTTFKNKIQEQYKIQEEKVVSFSPMINPVDEQLLHNKVLAKGRLMAKEREIDFFNRSLGALIEVEEQNKTGWSATTTYYEKMKNPNWFYNTKVTKTLILKYELVEDK